MNQSGRSMIEMLGVLAIVGVLSVGALKGYSHAMEKHKINEIVNLINTVIIKAQDLKGSSNNKVDVEDIFNARVLEEGTLSSDSEYIIMPSGLVIYYQGISNNTALMGLIISESSFVCKQLLIRDWFSEIKSKSILAEMGIGEIITSDSKLFISDVTDFCDDIDAVAVDEFMDMIGIGIPPEFSVGATGFFVLAFELST